MIVVFMSKVSTMAVGLSYINFATNNWLYSCFLSCSIKIKDAIHGAVVGNGEAIHAQFLSLTYKLGNAAHAIKQAVFSVNMKMSEFLWHLLNYSIGHCEQSEAISEEK